MKRFTLMVALLIVLLTLPAFAQDTRMFTIRNDDGTADEDQCNAPIAVQISIRSGIKSNSAITNKQATIVCYNPHAGVAPQRSRYGLRGLRSPAASGHTYPAR